MSLATIEIVEHTTPDDRRKGQRHFLVTSETPEAPQALAAARQLVIVCTAVRHENIALEGDAPHFDSLPDEVPKNLEVAQALVAVAQQLLDFPRLTQFPQA